jgi:hypothetical protein
MLVLSFLYACAEDAPKAPTVERRHHAAVPESPADREAEDDEAAPPSFGDRNRDPVIRAVHVKPAKPSRLDTIEVEVNATDPEHKSLKYSYEWSANGSRLYGPADSTLALADYERGDSISVTVRVSDGENEVSATSNDYVIVNADPRFEGKPTELRTLDGTRLSATDPDGDAVTFRMSGAPPGLTLDARGTLHFAGSETDAGGKFTLKIVADDGHGGSATLELPLTLNAGSKAPPAEAAVP